MWQEISVSVEGDGSRPRQNGTKVVRDQKTGKNRCQKMQELENRIELLDHQ